MVPIVMTTFLGISLIPLLVMNIIQLRGGSQFPLSR